jgi:hypothetical protein
MVMNRPFQGKGKNRKRKPFQGHGERKAKTRPVI